MKKTYKIGGMTCNGCRLGVENSLNDIIGVTGADVNLEKHQATVETDRVISLTDLQASLPKKYTISEVGQEKNPLSKLNVDKENEKTKLQQLKPLFLVLGYIAMASILMNIRSWDHVNVMLDFMGVFFFVFSFFKFLDLRGFADSFQMYDPLAREFRWYAWTYPFIELILGIMIFTRFELEIALAITIVVLSLTTVGVSMTLVQRKKIQCACLGSVLKLPMTLATFIENALMIAMAVVVVLGLT